MNWQNLFLSIDGRIGRKDFWLGAAVLIGAGLVGGLIPVAGPLVSLALIVPWTCLTAKRLHDFGRSGWLVLAAVVPSTISAAMALFTALATANVATLGLAFAGASLTLMVSTLAMLVSLGFLLWVGLKPSDAAPNAYGPAPAPVAAA